eukprot:7204828-Pyramimonas_sp.AAC.1
MAVFLVVSLGRYLGPCKPMGLGHGGAIAAAAWFSRHWSLYLFPSQLPEWGKAGRSGASFAMG